MSNILKINIFVWVCVVLIANHVRRDGMLDSDEFALAMHLMNIKLDGEYPSLYLQFPMLDQTFG